LSRATMKSLRRHHIILALCCLIALGLPLTGKAQFYNGSQISFGKNRVQHQDFNWNWLRGEKYDVYYYPTSKELAQYAYFKAPQYIAEIERLLNYTSNHKLQIIVYNTQADFRESNFAFDNEDFYNQGGITNIYGSKMYLYFDGNHAHFDRMLKSGLMSIYAHWLVDGNSVGSNMTAEHLMSIPSWFYDGLSSYYGEHWNSDIDAKLKDGILERRFGDFGELEPADATIAAHSFWKYIVDLYGEQSIARILYATRATKSADRGFSYALGVSYRAQVVNWFKYYYVMFYPDQSRAMPDGDELLKHPRTKRNYQNFCFHPEEDGYAYVTNEGGQIRVWLKRPDQKRATCIYKRYEKIEDNPDFSYPLIAWHPDGDLLGMTMELKGRCYYYPYDLKKKKWGKRFLVDVEKITSWQYAPDGQTMVFSGFKGGQSDIFIYSFLARSFQNLTRDFYDDYNPVFINSKQIVFASNRPKDTILLKDKFTKAKGQAHYDLFLYDYGNKSPALLRLTNTSFADEQCVQRYSKQQLLYLSNKDGLVNRYIARIDSAISRIDTAIHYSHFAKSSPLTDGAYSIRQQAYQPYTQTIADIIYKGKVNRIYRKPLELEPIAEVTPSVFHNKLVNESAAPKDTGIVKTKTVKKVTVNHVEHGFFQVYANEEETDNTSADSSANGFAEKEFYIPVGTGYRVQYTINKVITQADFSFLNTSYQQFEGGTSPIYLNTGFNALFMLGITDLFEDYRVTGGFRLSVDLSNTEFMLSYENLSKRIDRQIVAYRQSLTSSSSTYPYTQTANSLFYILKFPFNKTSSIRLSLNGRYETNVIRALSEGSLKEPTTRHLWGGVKLEYIFDSSKELYTNLWRGTKIKLFAEYEQRAEKETQNLFVVGFDARRSFKLYKKMTFAVRLAASANTGSARLVYYMGGTDNWINAKFNSNIWVDLSKNYAYQTLATNMRGFQQNIRNGTSFVLLSGELRVPFVQLIAGHNVSSNFFNSMQLNLFGDYGTAWTGLTPYSEDNCLYTRYIVSGPITAMVKRQVDPFVGGFGVGLRCSLLGYFLRFDYAWGVEDSKIANKKGMFMFSLCTDF